VTDASSTRGKQARFFMGEGHGSHWGRDDRCGVEGVGGEPPV